MSKKNKTLDMNEEEINLQEQEINAEQETAEDMVNDTLASLKDEFEQEKDRYLRLFAEFENFKKRTSRERIEMYKTAGEEVMVAMLPVLDDFDRALKEIEKSDDGALVQGVKLINSKLKETLHSKGLQTIETTKGEVFDADVHEAITQIPAPDDSLKGKIIEVLENGYLLGDKIIRYPKVIIGQ